MNMNQTRIDIMSISILDMNVPDPKRFRDTLTEVTKNYMMQSMSGNYSPYQQYNPTGLQYPTGSQYPSSTPGLTQSQNPYSHINPNPLGQIQSTQTYSTGTSQVPIVIVQPAVPQIVVNPACPVTNCNDDIQALIKFH